MTTDAVKESEVVETNEKSDGLPEEQIIPTTKFLVFSCSTSQKYAVYSDKAEEVLTDVKIYPIPFSPDFILGAVNQHGKINTVLSLETIFNSEDLNWSSFAENKIKTENDNSICLALKGRKEKQGFCLNTSKIYDFYDVKDDELQLFCTDDESIEVAKGTESTKTIDLTEPKETTEPNKTTDSADKYEENANLNNQFIEGTFVLNDEKILILRIESLEEYLINNCKI